MTPTRATTSAGAFAGFGLADALVAAVASLGYEEPTPVQRETIPLLLSGRDMLAQAATGTGKTAAFALPMLHRLLGGARTGRRRTRGLVLVPTRELAMQVAEAIHKYGRGSGLGVVPIYGGASMQQQTRALDRGVEVVVATPGRALDHLRRGSLDLSDLEVLVLDEADEMLDMGFAEDLDAILAATPDTRQTTLFAATMPPRILSIAQTHLKSPHRVTIAHEKTAAGKLPRVRQVAYVVARPNKPVALQRVLDTENPSSALVFCRTRLEVDTLVETLNAHGYRAEALHGGMQQRQRDAVMGRFRSAKADLLVATDVAARGLDIEQLSHVFNYDLPSAPEVYVHRIGRTGRAGREGTAITLLEPREHRLLKTIENITRQKIEVCPVPTVADLRARRLELTRASLRERLLQGNLDDARVVVQSLADEFDVMDVAAAAVQLAHAAAAGDGDEREMELPAPAPAGGPSRAGKKRPAPAAHPRRGGRHDRGGADGRDVVRLFIGAGRQAGVRPADLVGAIANEAGIGSRDLGAIEITDRYSLVEVLAQSATGVDLRPGRHRRRHRRPRERRRCGGPGRSRRPCRAPSARRRLPQHRLRAVEGRHSSARVVGEVRRGADAGRDGRRADRRFSGRHAADARAARRDRGQRFRRAAARGRRRRVLRLGGLCRRPHVSCRGRGAPALQPGRHRHGRPAAAPPIPGLDHLPFLTNETIFSLTELPRRLLVIGAGPIGCEMAQAFARFGSIVTVLDRASQVLPREDPDAAAIVRRSLEADGVRLELAVALDRVDHVGGEVTVRFRRNGAGQIAGASAAGDVLLVAAGRSPNIEGLGLEAAGIAFGPQGVIVNDRLQTSNRRVFASGDVCSAYKFTHAADAMSRIVIQNALFYGRRKASALVIPWVTYTDPEVAHVGSRKRTSGSRAGGSRPSRSRCRRSIEPWSMTRRTASCGSTTSAAGCEDARSSRRTPERSSARRSTP
jgi:ATP-dependent RNA helicase DeaD